MLARSVISFMETKDAPWVRKKAYALLVTSARDGLAASAVWFDDAAGTEGCVPADFLFWDRTADFMAELTPAHGAGLWGILPMPDLMKPARHKRPVWRNLNRVLERGPES